MLEDTRMDKKSLNRSSLQQSKATAVDCKKNSELTYKPWPRNNKKRETPGSSSKNDNNRKNIPAQRGRGLADKRPRPHGANNFAVGGTQNTGLENDEEPELGSLLMPGSKKQNLNHLLNFMYSPRGSNERRGPPPRRPVQNRLYHHFEHDLYLRSYCQFVVKQDGDYKDNLTNPDLSVKWEQIEEIIVRRVGKWQCPICLGHPVAGRVGICGHVYCWACILHYSATHEKQPPPCPVCTVTLQVADMKPTRLIQWDTSPEEVTMRLVRRLRGSNIVEVAPPRGILTEFREPSILPLEKQPVSPFARFFFTNHQQVHAIMERDRQEIEAQIEAEIDTTELLYLEQALTKLTIKKETLACQYLSPMPVVDANKQEDVVVIEKHEASAKKYDWFDVDEEKSAVGLEGQFSELEVNYEPEVQPDVKQIGFDLNDNPLEELEVRESPPAEVELNNLNEIDKENQARYFYFYQADDGQQVFLNSLNVRMLNASWGALVAAPAVIKGRVLHRDTVSLAEQTRKHMPYTAHLPLHCSFDVVELDLKPPYVTAASLENFAAELDRRARNRARQEREERRRERAYHRAAEGPPRPDFSSEVLFPPTRSPFGSPPTSEPSVLHQAGPSASTSHVEQPSPSTSSSSGLSFAKMAGSSGTWRVRKTHAEPSVPPPTADEEGEGHAPRSLNLSDAIEAALQATSNSPSNKKSKKSKQKLLFATGMNRSP